MIFFSILLRMHFSSQIFPDVTSIADRFKGLLLDAYGVFWGGNAKGLLPGSKEVLEKLIAMGKVVGILSNSTQLAAKEINKYQQHGLIQGQHFHFLVTSGEVTRWIFLQGQLPFESLKKRFWLLGQSHPNFASHEAIFQGTGYTETSNIDEADFIYISIPHINGQDQVDPELFRLDIEKIKSKNLPMVCANPDRFAQEGNPVTLVVRQGSLAKLYEEMGGLVFYIGKPEAKVYEFAMSKLQNYGLNHPGDILMVGDTPETDIRGARNFGLSSALVTETGIMGDRKAHRGLDLALQALPPQDIPDYLIQRFAHDICSSS
jgi:HAD superfamily hydrolase (TIGR01459 family)